MHLTTSNDCKASIYTLYQCKNHFVDGRYYSVGIYKTWQYTSNSLIFYVRRSLYKWYGYAKSMSMRSVHINRTLYSQYMDWRVYSVDHESGNW